MRADDQARRGAHEVLGHRRPGAVSQRVGAIHERLRRNRVRGGRARRGEGEGLQSLTKNTVVEM